MSKTTRIKISAIGIFVICVIGGFGFAGIASAAYYSSGNWTSTNLLTGETVSSIDSFIYNLSAKPANTGATIQFSQDNTNWYDAAGTLNASSTLTTGVDNTIDLSGLGWSGANFYYKATFTSSDGVDTPVLDDISVTFTGDITNPTVSTLSPADNATAVAVDSNLVITFSENVDAETGNINLYKTAGDVLVQAFNVTTDITGSGTNTITINPTSDLLGETAYYVKIDATAFDDAAGNSYAGIADTTTWNFTSAGAACVSNAAGNWSAAGTWTSCGGAVPGSSDTANVRHAVTVNQDVTVQGIVIDNGGKLNFDTTARTLQINETASGTAVFTVGASATAGELEVRPPTTGVHSIRLNATSTDASVGIEVESQGILDIVGTSSADQDILITNGGVTLDGTRDGYIYLKDGSETLIKNADISYMGANVANKYGISADVDGNTTNEGLLIDSASIHNGYYGVVLAYGQYNVIRNSTIYSNSERGIYANESSSFFVGNTIYSNGSDGIIVTTGNNNVISNNVFYNNGTTGPFKEDIDIITDNNTIIGNVMGSNGSSAGMLIRSGADNNYVYNNTVNGNGADGINVIGVGNTIKNNLLTSNADKGIDDTSATGNTINNNYYFNNTNATCSSTNGSCDTAVATGSGTNPNYVSTTGGNADFLYVSADSAALGPGLNIFAGTAPGTVNVGARLGYVKNTTDNEEFNWLQQAHDDASLGAGDTVTAYAVNVVSDTIAGNITEVGSIAAAYYTIKFDVAEATVVADNDHEGFYAYFTSGTNRGRYYLITDSDENTTDTLTILSEQATATFTVGDGFTIVDRVYTKDSGKSATNCATASTNNSNLCIQKNGTATSPITWNTSGTVIIDGQSIRTYGMNLYNSGQYNIIDGFIIINAANSGIQLRDADYSVFRNLFIGRNTHGGIINKDGTTTNVVFDSNVLTGTNGNASGQVIGAFGSSVYANNTFYDNNGASSLSTAINTGDNSLVFNNVLINNVRGIQLDGADNNIVRGNRIIGGSRGVNIRQATLSDVLINNTIIGLTGSGVGTDNGGGSTHRALNNIVGWNGAYGIQIPADSTSNFNFFYSNTTANTNGPTEGAGSIAGTDPGFYFEVGATNVTTGTTAYVDVTGTQAWTANQWVGYGLTFVDGSGTCPATFKNLWFGITSNSAENLFYAPTPANNTDITLCAAKVTGFYIANTTGATTPLGQGARHDGSTEPGTVNIGARLGYVVNDDGASADIKHNWLQDAHDHANVNAGDTLTAYTVDEVSSGTISSAADNGPYITLTLSTDTISANDDYIGYYLFMTSGTNANKYYLIIDSATVAGPADTIAINTAATTGFAASDTFKIIDRIYNKQGSTTNGANLSLGTSGSSGSEITWAKQGSVIISADNNSDFTADWAYNIFGETSVNYVKIDKNMTFYVPGSTSALGGETYETGTDYYCYQACAAAGGTLTFSLGANSVVLGNLSASAVTSGSHTITVGTNASNGVVVTYSGSTLTSGANTITAMSAAAASSVGTEQFGINAKDNATPDVGAECSGTAPIAAAATGYATVDNFKFVSGETIVSSSGSINDTTCTISYIANITAATEAGSYSATLTYVATGNF